MCGRVSQYEQPERVARLLEVQSLAASLENWGPRWNIGPQSPMLAVRVVDDVRELGSLRWGLVPSWAKDPKMALRTFNARAESVATKPTFRTAFRKRRAILPIDSFFEWQARPGSKRKQPYCFRRLDGMPIALAGLWEEWWGAGGEVELLTCTVVTTSAGPDMAGIHDRQPVILEPDTFDLWLDPSVQDVEQLTGLLVPGEGVLERFPVSPDVGSVRNDGPQLVEPIEPASPVGEQPKLLG